MDKFGHLICPVCGDPLINKGPSLACRHGHNFDVAGKGYVNLLLAQDKSSREPGDSKDMARARKRFLDRGYYEPLAKSIFVLSSQWLNPEKENMVFLDAGCGDGYYTDSIGRSFTNESYDISIYGMDISREAIRLAAGRNRDIGFFVASLFRIPFANESADFILNAFAPASNEEFSRILKKKGILVSVIPGKDHLFGLKSVLYENPYENDEKGPDLPSFRCADRVRIRYDIRLGSREDIADLLMMTPYYWRTPREGVERLKELSELETPVEFIVSVYK
ncbi:MAG TPA: methyltransferase domain-containing protein [Clostridiaceae bacterium]|nr:methyltransferase domain-containing protein [Clostridiaceae bacterium]